MKTASFRRKEHEKCALLGYDAANSGNFLPTLRDNLSAYFNMGLILGPEMSVKNYHKLVPYNISTYFVK